MVRSQLRRSRGQNLAARIANFSDRERGLFSKAVREKEYAEPDYSTKEKRSGYSAELIFNPSRATL